VQPCAVPQTLRPWGLPYNSVWSSTAAVRERSTGDSSKASDPGPLTVVSASPIGSVEGQPTSFVVAPSPPCDTCGAGAYSPAPS